MLTMTFLGLVVLLSHFFLLLFKRYLRLCDLQQKYTWHSNSSFLWGSTWVKKCVFELNIECLKLLLAFTVTPFVHFERWGLFVNWPQHLLVSFIGGMASLLLCCFYFYCLRWVYSSIYELSYETELLCQALKGALFWQSSHIFTFYQSFTSNINSVTLILVLVCILSFVTNEIHPVGQLFHLWVMPPLSCSMSSDSGVVMAQSASQNINIPNIYVKKG